MEALPTETQEESSVTNPRSVKSDDSSARSDGGRSSPPNCAICLGACENSSFTDSCLHQFCFNCLLTWSKVKAECPLCKQNFRSIIHNVRSLNQYEEYLVEQRQTDAAQMINIDNISQVPPRFRYRTTLTLPRRESLTAIRHLLGLHPFVGDLLGPTEAGAAPRMSPLTRYRSPTSFRRTVYRHNLWARPLPDFTGRFRDCSPQFYRYNDAQMHRLVPWLNRELNYLLNENPGHISYVLSRILDLLPYYHINSVEFMDAVVRFFGDRTEHFLHELYCFASTPYDMAGYDRNVQYTTDPRVSTIINEVITSESDSSDSDIVLVSSSAPPDPPAGPSRMGGSAPATDNVIPIETISHSDTDDNNSEVMVIGYIKPPQERTPEIVDLLGSDSDVVVQEGSTDPAPIASASSAPTSAPLVKLSLKRHRMPTPSIDFDNDDDLFVPRPRRQRPRSFDSATTVNTCRTTPSPLRSVDPTWNPSSPPTTPSSRSSPHERCSTASEDSEPVVKKRKSKKKSKSRRRDSDGKSKSSTDKRKSNKRKLKSRSWKEVKSSKKRRDTKDSEDSTAAVTMNDALVTDQPSTSGVSRRTSRRTDSKCTSKKERSERRSVSRESRRLRSVVSVPRSKEEINGAESLLSLMNSGIVKPSSSIMYYSGDSGSIIERPLATNTSYNGHIPPHNRTPDTSDSEDDIPLNLTVNRQ